ncbi:MAG TPA: NmrA family NAD(P)-binding protein [Hyphomicrobiales bacterium]|nr:NmrA family NAD(P)-binding protein [Hyphomicrobiales bacterium]
MTILVIGASGLVGGAVLDALRAAGAPVRAASRDPAAHSFPAGVETVAADLTRPETLGRALGGVDGVFLYARRDGAEGVVAAAKAAGVKRLVLLSSAAVAMEGADVDVLADMHGAVERAIMASGIPWTFLRATGFAANAIQWGWARSIRAANVVRLPYPEAQVAPIHEKDIADVAVAALLRGAAANEAPHLTGPRSLSQRQQVELIAEAIGRPIRIEALSHEEAKAGMSRAVPANIVEMMLGYWARSVGRPAEVTNEVERIAGHPARSFAEWARDHAADFTETAAA